MLLFLFLIVHLFIAHILLDMFSQFVFVSSSSLSVFELLVVVLFFGLVCF